MLTKSLQDLRPAVWMVHAAGAAVVVVAALAFYFGFFAPTAVDMQERTARMDQLQLLMGSSEQVARDHRVLQSRLAVLRQAAASTRKRMPRRTSTQEFLEAARPSLPQSPAWRWSSAAPPPPKLTSNPHRGRGHLPHERQLRQRLPIPCRD